MNLKVTKEVCDVRMCFMGGALLSGPLENVLGREGCSNNLWTHFNAAATFDACSKSHKENPIYSKAETDKVFHCQGVKTLNRRRLQNILQGSIFPKATQYHCVCGFHYSSFHMVSRNACSGLCNKIGSKRYSAKLR